MLTYHFYYKYIKNIGNLSIFKFQMLPKTLYPSPIAYGLGCWEINMIVTKDAITHEDIVVSPQVSHNF